jgi:hypothetical protein
VFSAVTTSLLVCVVKLFFWHVAVCCLCVCVCLMYLSVGCLVVNQVVYLACGCMLSVCVRV